MIEPIPSSAKYPYVAYALRPEDAAEARRVAALHVAGDAAWRATLVGWLARPREMRADLRRTPLDPRLARVVERLRARATAAGEDGDVLAQAIAGWSAAPRDVFAEAEDRAMNRALRTERLLELDAPAIIVDNEIAALARALAELDVPPAPEPVPHEEDDHEVADVPDGIVHRAVLDLSLGLHSETLRVLEHVSRSVGRDLAAPLAGVEPLVPFPVLEAAHRAATEEGARMLLARLRFWQCGPAASEVAEVAGELAQRLDRVRKTTRARVTKELDGDTHADLAGGDYVASAVTRLRAIERDAREAASEGLVVLSEVSRSLGYG